MAERSVGRALLLVFLALAMAGFGICSLCGGVMWVSELGNNRNSDLKWTIFMLSALGAALAAGCWWAIRKLRRPPAG